MYSAHILVKRRPTMCLFSQGVGHKENTVRSQAKLHGILVAQKCMAESPFFVKREISCWSEVMRATQKKAVFFAALITLVCATIAFGLYSKHTTALVFFLAWVAAELLIAKIKTIEILNKVRLRRSSSLIEELKRSYKKGEVLEERILSLNREPELSHTEQRFLRHLHTLSSFRSLMEAKTEKLHGKNAIRQAFYYTKGERPHAPVGEKLPKDVSLQDLMDSAMKVSEIYWSVFDCALSEDEWVQKEAKKQLEEVCVFQFDREKTAAFLEQLTDKMKRDHGLSFVVLNLLSKKEYSTTKQFAQFLLTSRYEVDERLRSVLYWIVELHWFTNVKINPLEDHESTVRFLYHLCFTSPERGGFLEIDSQFYSEFDTINELAREAFVFKDDLIENVLMLWKEYEGCFEPVFQNVMETLTDHRSKIHDSFSAWQIYWNREGMHLSKEYLYLVEGNVSFKSGYDEEAKLYYEKALEINPTLRPAIFNLLFVEARMQNKNEQEKLIKKILSMKELLPSSLYVIGNSYELVGNVSQANSFYAKLKENPEWTLKADYIRSLFCYEHGMMEKALKYALTAHEQNPNDSSIKYHLSLCYDSQGEKSRALDLLSSVGEGLEWMNYYRFKLQRDAGLIEQARETLLKIPTSYFEDEDELEEALDFAKEENDLKLLRHLKGRS